MTASALTLRRLAQALISLFGLCALTFVLLKNLPGGPFEEETPLHPLVRERLENSWALRGSVFEQFSSYLRTLFDGTLGWSMSEPGRSVGSLIRGGVGQTLTLNLVAIVAVFGLGLLLAMVGAWKPRSAWEQSLDSITLALVALPSLFLGPLLIWIFAMKLDWLPVAFLDSPWHYVLPVVTMTLRPAASVARILGASLREARSTDYMRTAHAKGLSSFQSLRRHALRNSLLPLLGYSSTLVVGLFSGSFIVEVLFAIRGLGTLFVEAIMNRDETLIMGLTLFYGTLLILISAALDVAMVFIDPRLRKDDA